MRHTEPRRAGGAGDGEALGRGRGAPRGRALRVGGGRGAADRAQGAGAPAARRRGALPATTPRGRRRGLRPLLHEPDLRRRRRSRRWSRVSAARRAAGLDPGRRGGQLLRAAVELERLRRRAPRTRPTTMVERLWALERRGRAADRRRRRLLHRRDRRTGGGGARPRRTPRTSPQLDDPRLGRLGRTTACCPSWRSSRKIGAAAIHPTCATHRQGHAWRLGALAAALADDVYLPPTGTCCGFAGDRGISHPELTAARHRATRPSELAAADFDAYLSQQPHLRDRHDPRHRPRATSR